jgi:hypothetical protein
MNDLWFEFVRLEHVGKYTYQRRFGFVKYREVQDLVELLSRLEDVWLRTFKLRINKSRFGKGDTRKTKDMAALETGKEGEARHSVGRSFKDALVVGPEKHQTLTTSGQGLVQGVQDVVWEVEVET